MGKTRKFNGSGSLARAGLGTGSMMGRFTPAPKADGNRAERREHARRAKRLGLPAVPVGDNPESEQTGE